MRKYFKYIGVFIAGAVSYQLSIMALLPTASNNDADLIAYYGKEQSGYSISTDHFKSELNEACEYLEGQGCLCEHEIKTNHSCKQLLNGFIHEISMNKLKKDHGIKNPIRPKGSMGPDSIEK